MPYPIEAYGGEPVVEAIMKLVGLWVDGEDGKPARLPVNFVIEARQGNALKVYVEEYVPGKTAEEVADIMKSFNTTSLRNEVFHTARPCAQRVDVPAGHTVVVNPDCTVDVKPAQS